MSAAERIPAHEDGKLRVYAVDPESDTGRAVIDAFEEPGPLPGPDAGPAVAAALGAERIEGTRLSLVRTEAFKAMGIGPYFADGHDVPEAELAAHRPALDRAEGALLVVPSSAFGGAAQEIAPDPALTPVATLATARDAAPAGPIRSTAAEGRAAPSPAPEPAAPASDRRLSPGLVLGLVLIAGVIIALMALIGGAG